MFILYGIIHPTQQTTQRQQLIEVATNAPCCGTQGKTRISVEAGDPSVSGFRGFAVTRPANDGCTGMIASTAVSTCRVISVHASCPVQRKTKQDRPTEARQISSDSQESHHIRAFTECVYVMVNVQTDAQRSQVTESLGFWK